MNRFFVGRCFVVALVFGIAPMLPPIACADEPLASVNGTGYVDMNDDFGLDLQFRTTVSSFVNPDGSVRGTVVGHVDLSVFGLGRLDTVGHVVQIVIDGNQAWVCSEVFHTNNPDLVPVGSHSITWIVDLGGQREDIMHTEFAHFLPVGVFDMNGDGVVDCFDRPILTPTFVDQGNFEIR